MIRIHLSRILGERRWKQHDLVKETGIRPNTINAMYHEFIMRISLEHLDLICSALDCQVSDLIEYIPNEKDRKK